VLVVSLLLAGPENVNANGGMACIKNANSWANYAVIYLFIISFFFFFFFFFFLLYKLFHKILF
jgi:hypothetical protein